MPKIYRRCPGCRRRFSRRSRPVCYRCRKRGVKALPRKPQARPDVYAPAPGRGSRGVVPDFYGSLPSPTRPTTAIQGTAEKMAVLMSRLERGEGLWHPQDGAEPMSATGMEALAARIERLRAAA